MVCLGGYIYEAHLRNDISKIYETYKPGTGWGAPSVRFSLKTPMITCKSFCDKDPLTLSSLAEISVCTSASSGSKISRRSTWKVMGSRTRLKIVKVSSSTDNLALEIERGY